MTLDTGTCPPWLFERMVQLGRSMTDVLIDEYGPDEYIKRIADPVWFQSFGTVLAFDWNASGLTTILTAALKEAIRGREKELGVFIAGGKGATSRKTPEQIESWGARLLMPTKETNRLVYSSKMSAKVDSSLIQDDYTLYHHAFFFSRNGAWTVVQQGMNTKNSTARRYHWHCDNPADIDFTVEPHKGIASQAIKPSVLNLVDKKSGKNKDLSVEMIGAGYKTLMHDIELLRRHSGEVSRMLALHGRQATLRVCLRQRAPQGLDRVCSQARCGVIKQRRGTRAHTVCHTVCHTIFNQRSWSDLRFEKEERTPVQEQSIDCVPRAVSRYGAPEVPQQWNKSRDSQARQVSRRHSHPLS